MMHYLSANKSTRFPSSWAFLHVESTINDHESNDRIKWHVFKSGAMRLLRLEKGQPTRERIVVFDHPLAAFAMLFSATDKRRPLWCVSYDCARTMTMLGLWDLIDKEELKLLSLVDADPPTIIRCQWNGRIIMFLDLRNWFTLSLDQLTVPAGLRPEEDSEDVHLSPLYNSPADLGSAKIRDMMLGLVGFLKDNDMGVMKMTLPSQAMQAYRHRFGPRMVLSSSKRGKDNVVRVTHKTCVLPHVHDNAEVKDVERKACFGGQAECYFVGVVLPEDCFWKEKGWPYGKPIEPYTYGPIYHVDCNSLFPHVMRENTYPSKLLSYCDSAGELSMRMAFETPFAVAVVKIDTATQPYPVRHDGRVLYACGKFWTTLCGAELRLAMFRGHVDSVEWVASYETAPLFESYVDELAQLKQKYAKAENAVYYNACKLLMNSLYGKWSERRHKWEPVADRPAPYRWGKWYECVYPEPEVAHFRAIAGVVQRRTVQGELHHSSPIISAAVTSNARLYMQSIRCSLPPRSVIYQGIDSLLVNDAGYNVMRSKGLLDSAELGKFKLVGKHESGRIVNVRNYQLDGQRFIAGLPIGAAKITEEAYSYTVRQGLGGMLDTCPGLRVTYATLTGTWQKPYSGGIVGKDGWTKPFTLGESNGHCSS